MLSLSSDNPTATGLLPLSLPAGLPRPGSSTGAPEASPGGVGVTRLAPRGAATARRGAASFGGGGEQLGQNGGAGSRGPDPAAGEATTAATPPSPRTSVARGLPGGKAGANGPGLPAGRAAGHALRR